MDLRTVGDGFSFQPWYSKPLKHLLMSHWNKGDLWTQRWALLNQSIFAERCLGEAWKITSADVLGDAEPEQGWKALCGGSEEPLGRPGILLSAPKTKQGSHQVTQPVACLNFCPITPCQHPHNGWVVPSEWCFRQGDTAADTIPPPFSRRTLAL